MQEALHVTGGQQLAEVWRITWRLHCAVLANHTATATPERSPWLQSAADQWGKDVMCRDHKLTMAALVGSSRLAAFKPGLRHAYVPAGRNAKAAAVPRWLPGWLGYATSMAMRHAMGLPSLLGITTLHH
jgi:hypothetical protein